MLERIAFGAQLWSQATDWQGFLDAALHSVDVDHGGVERYLLERLGLTNAALDALAARYLSEEPLA